MAAKKENLSLDERIAKLEKDYGKGSVIHGNVPVSYTEVVSTGSLGLDIATGIGGIPIGDVGKVIEIYGWESSGKSTLSQTIMGNYQKMGKKKCLYIDGENSLEGDYSSKLGIDFEDLYVVQLDSSAGEGAYDKMEVLVESGEFGLVIIDSYNSLQPKKVLEDPMGTSAMGLHARMLGTAVVKANSLASEYGTTFIFIGQLREKIGVMFGSPETTQGGNALKFYTHMRMVTSRSTTHDNSTWEGKKGESERLGNQHTVNIIKNKLAKPFTKAKFNIIYGEGIDKYSELIDLADQYELLKLYGDNVTYEGTKTPVEEFKQMLIDQPELFEFLRNAVLEEAGINEKIEEIL